MKERARMAVPGRAAAAKARRVAQGATSRARGPAEERREPRSAARVLVVYKKSAWQTNVKERRNPRYLELVDAGHEAIARLEAAHAAHLETLEETRTALAGLGARSVFRFRGDEGLVEGFDLVVTVGGDGTLLWAARWVGPDVPVVAINSAPHDSVGHFCAGRKGSVRATLEAALGGVMPAFRLSRMEVSLDGETITRRVLNDVLFAHASPAATTRYIVRVDDGRGRVAMEEHKSSGIWIGPSAGSTAAQRSAGGEVLPAESERIQYVVREPYVPDDGTGRPLEGPRLRVGTVGPTGSLAIVSKVREGRLFVDGPHRVRDVQMGSEVVLRRSDEPLTLLGYPRAMVEGRKPRR
jgi:NAD+ kinase